jgi:hypothetical protein
MGSAVCGDDEFFGTIAYQIFDPADDVCSLARIFFQSSAHVEDRRGIETDTCHETKKTIASREADPAL